LIYVAVATGKNGSSTDHPSRYKLLDGEPVADEISAARDRRILRLKPHLTLHVGELPPSDGVGFPVARVSYRNSSFTLDENFIPPLLSVPVRAKDGDASSAAAQRLGEMCTQLALRVRKRAMYLADEARNPGAGSRFGNETAARSVMLSLAGALPEFEAVLQTGRAHPYQLYVALCGLAGHIATLGTDMVPPAFDPYNHNDLYKTFQPVLEFIDRAMDYGVPIAYKSFLFNYNEGAYELRFDSTWMKKKLALGIKGERGMSEAEVVKWGESCLIGSQNTIEVLKTNRIRGAVRKHADRVGDIVTPKGVALFSLMADESYVQPETLLKIVNYEGPRPCEIVLYVLDN
jgi:type VI secretion system protein ImpJ